MKPKHASPHHRSRDAIDEKAFLVCLGNSIVLPPALSALQRKIGTNLPGKMKHLFSCRDYTTKSFSLQAKTGEIFIPTLCI